VRGNDDNGTQAAFVDTLLTLLVQPLQDYVALCRRRSVTPTVEASTFLMRTGNGLIVFRERFRELVGAIAVAYKVEVGNLFRVKRRLQ
jgi:hypothetical protein